MATPTQPFVKVLTSASRNVDVDSWQADASELTGGKSSGWSVRKYGLAGGIWCGDPARARQLATQVRTGRIRINGTPIDMRAPHGGFKLSGLGREMGKYGIEEFLEYKSVIG